MALGGQWSKRRAVIIGGSMSGLFTAAFLRQIGWQADVYERSGVELVGRGAGITTHPELLAALEASGAGTKDLGVTVDKRIALDLGGNVIAEKHLTQILTSWDRLQRLLRDTIEPAHYHLGCNFERVEQERRRRSRPFLRWPRRGCRYCRRWRRRPLLGPRANHAGGAADLCRLLHLARHSQRGRSLAARAERCLSVFLLFCRRSKRSSAIRFPDSTMTSGRATAASISSGIASPTQAAEGNVRRRKWASA